MIKIYLAFIRLSGLQCSHTIAQCSCGPVLLVSWREITYLSHFPGWLSSQTHLQPEFHKKLSSPKRAKEGMKLGKC